MKKLVVALAMVPALSHAELIVLDPPKQHASSAPAAASTVPAVIKIGPAPAIVPGLAQAPAPASSGFIDIRSTVPAGAVASESIRIRPEPQPVPVFVAKVGSTARQAVESWAVSAGWKATWRAQTGDGKVVNYNITEADVRMQGRVDEVVSRFIHLYDEARFPLKVQINPDQKLFVISLKH
jgi:hypothetical protein